MRLYKGIKSLRVHNAIRACGFYFKSQILNIRYLYNFEYYLNYFTKKFKPLSNLEFFNKKVERLSNYLKEYENNDSQFTVIIAKKVIAKSVDRNKIRRQMRELLKFFPQNLKIFARVHINKPCKWEELKTEVNLFLKNFEK